MRPIAFLDIETTGLSPKTAQIIEVACITRSPWPTEPEHVEHFSLPIDITRAEPKALEVNGYYEREDDLAEIRLTKERAAVRLHSALKDATVVGNNVQFDLRFIEEHLLPDTPWHYCPLDLKAFVGGRCGMVGPATTKTIEDVSGIRLPKDAHTALADATWNRDVYDALVFGVRGSRR